MVRQILACCRVRCLGSVLRSSARQAPGPPPIDILGVEPLEFGEVGGRRAPFTAEAVTEMTQELRDGNRIERRSTTTIARDGRGRVRREQALPLLGPVVLDPDVRMITISDPAPAGRLYASIRARRTVSKSTMPAGAAPAGPSPATARAPRSRGGRSRCLRPSVASETLGTRQIAGIRADGTRQTLTIPAGRLRQRAGRSTWSPSAGNRPS